MTLEQSKQYLRRILPKVSRTFALNIRVLSPVEYDFIGTIYLICRFIDTIEDSPTLENNKKISILNQFIDLFNSDFQPKNFRELIKSANGISENSFENDLIYHFEDILQLYCSFPSIYREISYDMIIEMAKGMRDFVEKYQHTEKKILADIIELEKYCYYVAGTVGVILTRFFSLKIPSISNKEILTKYTNDFGLALQMTNILKDFHDDKKRGWAYVPITILQQADVTINEFYGKLKPEKIRVIRQLLIDIIEIYIKNSIEYSVSIPRKQIKYRLFCLIPLFLAIKTVYHLKNLPTSRIYQKKITKKNLFYTLFITYIICPSNFLIKKYYNSLKK